jgi:lipid-A-disaccharide synthase-like uncharacterized protein
MSSSSLGFVPLVFFFAKFCVATFVVRHPGQELKPRAFFFGRSLTLVEKGASTA